MRIFQEHLNNISKCPSLLRRPEDTGPSIPVRFPAPDKGLVRRARRGHSSDWLSSGPRDARVGGRALVPPAILLTGPRGSRNVGWRSGGREGKEEKGGATGQAGRGEAAQRVAPSALRLLVQEPLKPQEDPRGLTCYSAVRRLSDHRGPQWAGETTSRNPSLGSTLGSRRFPLSGSKAAYNSPEG